MDQLSLAGNFISQDTCDRILAGVDMDGDGRISYEELLMRFVDCAVALVVFVDRETYPVCVSLWPPVTCSRNLMVKKTASMRPFACWIATATVSIDENIAGGALELRIY